MKLTIAIHSTALFSTWVFIEELGILFDAGDGVVAALQQKLRKATSIFVSHADRDHVTGLLRLHELNASGGKPRIYYPQDSGSFPALRDFAERFDPHTGPATWIGLESDQTVAVNPDTEVHAAVNNHMPAEIGKVKSLDYLVYRCRRKLREQWKGTPGSELARLRQSHGEDYLTQIERDPLLGFSGDTPTFNINRWRGVEVLIHECSFLNESDGRGSHCVLPDAIAGAAEARPGRLILTHFSSRYEGDSIRQAICEWAHRFKIPFPIDAVLPGETVFDLLARTPVWSGLADGSY